MPLILFVDSRLRTPAEIKRTKSNEQKTKQKNPDRDEEKGVQGGGAEWIVLPVLQVLKLCRHSTILS